MGFQRITRIYCPVSTSCVYLQLRRACGWVDLTLGRVGTRFKAFAQMPKERQEGALVVLLATLRTQLPMTSPLFMRTTCRIHVGTCAGRWKQDGRDSCVRPRARGHPYSR